MRKNTPYSAPQNIVPEGDNPKRKVSDLPFGVRQLFEEKLDIITMHAELVELLHHVQLTKTNYNKIKKLFRKLT